MIVHGYGLYSWSAEPSSYPPALKVSAVTRTKATFSWKKIPVIYCNGNLSGYMLVITERTARGPEGKFTEEPNVKSTRIIEFTPCTQYTSKIAAINNEGIGPFSPPVLFMTKGGKYSTDFCIERQIQSMQNLYSTSVH